MEAGAMGWGPAGYRGGRRGTGNGSRCDGLESCRLQRSGKRDRESRQLQWIGVLQVTEEWKEGQGMEGGGIGWSPVGYREG